MSRNQTRFPVLSAREEFRIGNSVAFRHGLGFDICGKTFRAVHLDTTAPVTQRTCTLPTGHRGDHLSDPAVLRRAITARKENKP